MKPHAATSRSIEDLIEFTKRGVRPKYVYFWGHTPKIPGRIDQSCLSNWFPAVFHIDGTRYSTIEHYMMAEKANLFSDYGKLEQIVSARSPGKAKALGRQVRGFNDDIWVKHRYEIVVKGNYAKFHQNKELGKFLIETGTKVLVEASPHDRIWGIGIGKDDNRAQDPIRWRGLNLLGFALMEVRAKLTR
jgi:ribA/ribD-fused uncharacterized protein